MLTKPFIELPLKGLVEDVLANSLDLMSAGGVDWVVPFSPSLGPLVTRSTSATSRNSPSDYVATPPSVPVALPPAAIPLRSTPLRSTRRCIPSGFALRTARPLAPPIVTLDLSTSFT
ncbi:hypothetical protein JCM11641_002082 [Rhodosporidiobolus odoratus]